MITLRSIAVALLPIIIAFGVIKCDTHSKPSSTQSLAGTYRYVGYDKNGSNKVVEGQLQITSLDANRMKGKWDLKAIGNAPNLGPQVGSGVFEGEVTNDGLQMNLNPNMADNNVTLAGKIEGRKIRGEWSYSGFAGVINRGTFEATKK
ncbi:MAG: hypothetical protein C5B44_03465 [Acidobacteria bacterium]|nr:MAG: hypothetical protein C5B44_03465 [Acidobacteriota bacterium]